MVYKDKGASRGFPTEAITKYTLHVALAFKIAPLRVYANVPAVHSVPEIPL
jgi:hypothetical protein